MNRPLIRVERGGPTEAELAALTAILLARLAGAAGTGVLDSVAPGAGWQRPERHAPYRSPVSWRR